MKRQCLYIIMCIFSLLALPGCRDEEAVQTSEGTRTVTVNLGIAMSRVTKGSSVGDGSTPKDMKVWIFNQDNTELVDYYEIENPTFSGSDALGELVNTHERIIELDNSITELNFYVVLNSVSGTGINLSKSSSVNDIQNATFTGLQNVTGDNQVPVYGKTTLDVSDHQNSYPVTIETTRAVSKLEMFFTKENASSDLKINRITLENIPDKGLLAREIELADIANYDKTETLFEDSNSNGKEITTDLPASESPVGDFSNHPDDFVQIDLSQAYLSENPNNNEWDPTTGSDYEYPEAAPSIKNAYVLTVEYTLDGTEKKQEICLPKIKRNVWNKIFARVTSNGYELLLSVNPWEREDITVNYEDNLSYVSNGWGNTILGIINNDPTQIHVNPDQIAVLTFMINTPSGALWRATLSNYTDFEFVGPSSGAAFSEGSPVAQTIQVRVTNPESDDPHETELRVYADIGGVTYEMDLTNPSEGEITPGDNPVNHFTLIQRR